MPACAPSCTLCTSAAAAQGGDAEQVPRRRQADGGGAGPRLGAAGGGRGGWAGDAQPYCYSSRQGQGQGGHHTLRQGALRPAGAATAGGQQHGRAGEGGGALGSCTSPNGPTPYTLCLHFFTPSNWDMPCEGFALCMGRGESFT